MDLGECLPEDPTEKKISFLPLVLGQVILRFQVQFGINLHEWVFQTAEIAQAAWKVQFPLFEKVKSAN